MLGDPLEGLLVHLLGVRLEHQPLAWTPAARVDQRVIAHREFVLVIVRVAIGPQIDVALCAAQRAEEFA